MQTLDIQLKPNKKAYFASDFHLGTPSYEASREREGKIVAWIEEHRPDMGALFLLGDVFDYWFEYRYTIPKGYTRLLGKLAELTDAGIPVYFFCGNHDAWHIDFFEKELGIKVLANTALVTINGRKFVLGHGDGLGPGQRGYKLMKAIFSAKASRILYAAIHPYWAQKFASNFSHRSRKTGSRHQVHEHGKNCHLICFMHDFLKREHVDAFILAHRHWPVLVELPPCDMAEEKPGEVPGNVRVCGENRVAIPVASPAEAGTKPRKAYYLNTGDWLQYFSYGVFDGEVLSLHGQNLKTEL